MEMTDNLRRAMHREPALRQPKAHTRPAVPSQAPDSAEPAQPGAEPLREAVEAPEHCLFTIPGAPIGKPRMTQRDKWKKRPCVMRYREWADRARLSAPEGMTQDPTDVNWTAYLPMPKSWSEKKREAMMGQLHRQKPDSDNISKALFDALFKSDCGIATGSFRKCWDDGNGPRLIVAVL